MRVRMYLRHSISSVLVLFPAFQIQYGVGSAIHYYRNLFCGGRFGFTAAVKRVRRGQDVTVNCGVTAAGAHARCGKSINRGGWPNAPASVNRFTAAGGIKRLPWLTD